MIDLPFAPLILGPRNHWMTVKVMFLSVVAEIPEREALSGTDLMITGSWVLRTACILRTIK